MADEVKLQKQDEQIQFNDDELKQVKSIQDEYFSIQSEFGNIQMTRLRLDRQFDELEVSEQKLGERLEKVEEKEVPEKI